MTSWPGVKCRGGAAAGTAPTGIVDCGDCEGAGCARGAGRGVE